MPTAQHRPATSRTVLNEDEIARTLTRMAHQIVELNHGVSDLALLGVQTRGVPLAYRLKSLLEGIEPSEIPIGELDITLYRDDLRKNPTRRVGSTKVNFSLEDKTVLLIDDVLFSGRTIVAALDALKDLVGRPHSVELAVLIDRGHREFPISADLVGKTVMTAADERANVALREIDGFDEVVLHRTTGDRL